MNGDSSIGTFGDLRLKIEPVERLRTVTALTGFSRGAITTSQQSILLAPFL